MSQSGLFQNSFIGKTGQSCKFVVGFLGMGIGLVGLFGSLWMDDIGRDMGNVALFFLASALLSGSYGVFGTLCPRCRSYPVWIAVSQHGVGSWLVWLEQLQECPTCKYRPEPAKRR